MFVYPNIGDLIKHWSGSIGLIIDVEDLKVDYIIYVKWIYGAKQDKSWYFNLSLRRKDLLKVN